MKLIIFAGPNGSGKSTIVAEYLKLFPDMLYICPDSYYKNYLCLYKQINVEKKIDVDDYNFLYSIAMKSAEKDRYTAISKGYPFALETVFSKREKIDFIKHALKNQYSVEVIYVTTRDPKINIERVKKRVSEGGHSVPEQKIVKRYYESMQILPEIIAIANDVTVYDNSETDGRPMTILNKNENGFVFFFNNGHRPDWCDELKEILSRIPELILSESDEDDYFS